MAKRTLSKQYDPTDVEPRWLKFWASHDYYRGEDTAAKAPFAITLPPPNVTGSLHMGHALGNTIQDILVRWRRMQGYNAMWMPGSDHAGIATQMLVERDLARTENKSRHDVGREAFLDRVWKWKDKYGGRIDEQLRLMGYSLDWPRARFTMDEASSSAVREAFVQLYDDGLIYRAERLVNWCSDCFTALSDLEVNNIKEPGSLWEIHYPVVDSDVRITVATTRPETMLGDTAVAVHPEDERYLELIGRSVRLPLCDRGIPIVADDFVDREFGSGAVKITPAHDQNDFDCSERHGLPRISVIDTHGKIVAPAPEKYCGMTVAEARTAVVDDLEAQGFLGEVKKYEVPKGRCDRSRTVVEPLLSKQWFVKTKTLAEPAIAAVEAGETKFVPELWTKTYMHWMTNIRDWCISRQLWWGHRIPAWYCQDCDGVVVAKQTPQTCPKCQSTALVQDEDVLDTWFSSGLWPFSTLGWPESTTSLHTFYPNAVLVTGPDIIFFWVARMMMMGLRFMGKVPFRTVYLTPIVTDESGDKMSKTKGNVIDPLNVVYGASQEQLVERARVENLSEQAIATIRKTFKKGITTSGADALRFSLAAMTMPGRNIRLSMERVEGYRNFINKLWNASRFVLMNLDGYDPTAFADRFERVDEFRSDLTLADRWILSRVQTVSDEVDEALNQYRFSDAASALYHFVWGEFCGWYIELAKPQLHASDDVDVTDAARRHFTTQGILTSVLETTLRLLHPFIPFVSEEIWQALPKPPELPESLMITVYPRGDDRYRDLEAERDMAFLQEVTVAIRALRSTYGVPPSSRVPVEVRIPREQVRAKFTRQRSVVENAGRVVLTITESGGHVAQAAKSIVGADVEIVVPLAGLVDIDAEKKRIAKDIGKAEKEIAFVKKKLDNEKFVARAPAEVVEKEKVRLGEEQERRQRLVAALEALQ